MFISVPPSQILLKSGVLAVTVPAPVVTELSSYDLGVGSELASEKDFESFDASTGLDLPVKVALDLALGGDLPVKVATELGSATDLVSYMLRILSQTGSGTDAVSAFIVNLYVYDTLKSLEKAFSAESITSKSDYLNRINTLLPKLRTVTIGDEVLSDDITVPRDILYTVASWLILQGLDISKLSQAQSILSSIDIQSGDILRLEYRNKLADALKLILESLTNRYIPTMDASTSSENAVIQDMTPLFKNLCLTDPSGTICMDSPNVRRNWCPSAWSSTQCNNFMAGWDYVFWIEDQLPLSSSDQDYEDVVIRVKISNGQITIDIWQGEHGYTENIYWKNTLVVTIPSRRASKYSLAYVGTWTFPYP